MPAVGSLIFCDSCSNLLPPSQGNVENILVCDSCGTQNRDAPFKTIVTGTKPSDFPSPLRQKLSSVQTVERHKLTTEATTQQECPKCGRTEVRFSAVQQRSADEGSTIFYTCDCGFKWSENN